MELTLLHAQQMELLNDEYNKKINDLNQKIIVFEELQKLPKEDNEEKKNFLRKIAELNDIINKQNNEIKELLNENKFLRENVIYEEESPSTNHIPSTKKKFNEVVEVIYLFF